MDQLKLIAVEGDASLLGTEAEKEGLHDWMAPQSIEEFEFVRGGELDWPIITIGDIHSSAAPIWRVHIPINQKYILQLELPIKIHSKNHFPSGITKPELDQLRKDIRDEILSHINVTYSPELLQTIRKINT